MAYGQLKQNPKAFISNKQRDFADKEKVERGETAVSPHPSINDNLHQQTNGKLARAGNSLLQLQNQYGNQYVQRLINPQQQITVQPKLMLGDVNTPSEREADQIAHDVMRNDAVSTPTKVSGSVTPITPKVESKIKQARSGGRQLPENIRTRMEQSFGTDLNMVRIHTNSQADNLTHSLRARAFTTGQDIFFRHGHFKPNSNAGQHLLAHELTHVCQQGNHNNTTIQRLDEGDLSAKDKKKLSQLRITWKAYWKHKIDAHNLNDREVTKVFGIFDNLVKKANDVKELEELQGVQLLKADVDPKSYAQPGRKKRKKVTKNDDNNNEAWASAIRTDKNYNKKNKDKPIITKTHPQPDRFSNIRWKQYRSLEEVKTLLNAGQVSMIEKKFGPSLKDDDIHGRNYSTGFEVDFVGYKKRSWKFSEKRDELVPHTAIVHFHGEDKNSADGAHTKRDHHNTDKGNYDPGGVSEFKDDKANQMWISINNEWAHLGSNYVK